MSQQQQAKQQAEQQVQQQAEQQVQQQAQAFMSQRANAGPPLAPSNPQPSQPSKPQSSQASYLQKAARRANWTPSNSIQPLTPQAGVVLTGTASEGEAPLPYRSAPDFPPAAPPPPPPFAFLPAPDVPLPKKSVSFSGGPSVHE